MLVRYRADRIDDREVGGEILVRIAGVIAAPVALGKLVAAAHRAREEAAAERRIGDEADAMLAADGKDFVLHIAFPDRLFALQRGVRRGIRGTAPRFGPGFQKRERKRVGGGKSGDE